jgi:1,2-dihydroxy-3-keto-5-methylthiopentene dioxygenase
MKAFHLDDQSAIDVPTLAEQGVWTAHWDTTPDNEDTKKALAALQRDGGYMTKDVIELNSATTNLAVVLRKFDGEHRHSEDEVRFVLEGAGVFDIRSHADRMMRVIVEAGDVIVVPRDRYHRFELTTEQCIRCVRLFREQAGWVPDYRPTTS